MHLKCRSNPQQSTGMQGVAGDGCRFIGICRAIGPEANGWWTSTPGRGQAQILAAGGLVRNQAKRWEVSLIVLFAGGEAVPHLGSTHIRWRKDRKTTAQPGGFPVPG